MSDARRTDPTIVQQSALTASHPTFGEAFRFWLKLGFISFGGPTGQIAIMHTELVERRRWVREPQFLHALNFCMLLPGPEAQQLAIYIGWLLHRTAGGLAAGILFVLPSAILLWMLSFVYAAYGSIPWILAAFAGLKPAVLGIVADALLRIGRRSLKTPMLWSISAAAFVALFFLRVPFPAIILSAGLIGMGLQATPWRRLLTMHRQDQHDGATGDVAPSPAETDTPPVRPLARAARILLLCGLLWTAPIICTGAVLGWRHTLVGEGVFFSKAAMVTFGGAYAVLPYVAQQAVENYGWLGPEQMLDGLGLAETTPGPLIMVVQFVGFLGAWNHPGELPPLLAATIGAALTTWVTFTPCFLWIFLSAPYIETMRRYRHLSAALTAITAAVVGVILNLAVWFGIHVLQSDKHGFDWFSWILATAAFVALRWLRLGVVRVVGLAAVAGLVRHALAT